ncbi:DUF551 domain-containing protein, partial [Mannheimia haemolytica]|nr:DUF551 domain-containing protein [Mannheimia haemolytica]MDW1133152.1 DUF551 domain-containing protein [Mannheimia haemolytica]MDW1145996.1 DUF551 domain-containing protein [Mannheimia haemolytica]MDW1156054.1 DUF551 domain-containing protein [Mannheimia haemolytica]
QSCLNGAAEAYEFASEMDDCENYEANDLPYAVYGVVLGRAKSDIRPLTSEEKESGYFEEVDNFIEQPELVETNGWISVKDKLPPIETDVLGLCDISGMQLILIVSRELADNEWYFLSVNQYGLDDDVIAVTHWQPLPKLPKDNQ